VHAQHRGSPGLEAVLAGGLLVVRGEGRMGIVVSRRVIFLGMLHGDYDFPFAELQPCRLAVAVAMGRAGHLGVRLMGA